MSSAQQGFADRDPLMGAAFARLPLGTVQPRGWLREQLHLSAIGLSGRLMEVWPDVGADSGWLGGGGENWERGPYYVRGLLSLAHALGDAALLERVRPWIEWSIRSQRPDGFFGPADNDDWWPRMPMLEALRWHAEASGDDRVAPLMQRYFRHLAAELPQRPLEAWGKPRGGDYIDSALWLYRRTGETFLLGLADLLHAQTSDWVGELGGDAPPREEFEFGHGVNRAMGFKEPVVYYQRSRQVAHLAALRRGWQRTMAHHGQINGMFAADEFLHGTGSTQGTEFCTIVETLSSFEIALAIGGELWLADAIERIAYNAMPAILSADHCTHQYFQLPNQIECTPGGRNFHVHHETDLLFGVATGYGCCAANYHVGWPQLAAHCWMATREGGLAALVLAPSAVTVRVAGGPMATIEEETEYPFGESIVFTVRTAAPVEFPLSVRIPAWAESAEVQSADGTDTVGGGQLHTWHRVWRDGEQVSLHLPMTVRASRWERGSIGLERGPLVFALPIGEDWRAVAGTAPFCDYEVHPTTPWNYGLRIDPADVAREVRVERGSTASQPWARNGAGVKLVVPGQRIPEWTAVGGVSGPIPEGHRAPTTPIDLVELVPYGCARLRISMFPLVG